MDDILSRGKGIVEVLIVNGTIFGIVITLQNKTILIIMSSTKESILKSIVALGLKVLPKGARLILYGSQARGDTHQGSDWDLLILLDDDHQEEDVFANYGYPFVELGWEFGSYFSPKIYTYSEWAFVAEECVTLRQRLR